MHKILLIEDDELLRKSITAILADRLYQIKAIADGETGLKTALHESFDLIILDLMLPKLSGFLVVKHLREAGKETPVLIMSTKTQLSDLMTALNYGADGYLYKPFNVNELICRAEGLIKRPPHSRPTIIKMGQLVFDGSDCAAKYHGQALKMQKRQLDILHYLMNNPDRIITKKELINSVWNYDADVLPSTLDVHISRLRSALSVVKVGPRLESYHGYGIKLVRQS